jgi:hypothetical protein
MVCELPSPWRPPAGGFWDEEGYSVGPLCGPRWARDLVEASPEKAEEMRGIWTLWWPSPCEDESTVRLCEELPRPEFDFGGCPAVGVGGRHSEAYGDDGEWICDWCGGRPRHPVAACQGDSLWIQTFPHVAPHGEKCGCPECVPCAHHPGVDCNCWCRYMGCSPRNCAGDEGAEKENGHGE